MLRRLEFLKTSVETGVAVAGSGVVSVGVLVAEAEVAVMEDTEEVAVMEVRYAFYRDLR